MADSASESDTDGAGGSGGGGSAAGALAAGGPAAAGPGGGGGGSGSAGGGKAGGIVISPFRLEELTNRLASLQQENKVLKIELETYKLKCKALQEENRDLRKASVTIVSAGGAAGGGGGAAPGLGTPRAAGPRPAPRHAGPRAGRVRRGPRGRRPSAARSCAQSPAPRRPPRAAAARRRTAGVGRRGPEGALTGRGSPRSFSERRFVRVAASGLRCGAVPNRRLFGRTEPREPRVASRAPELVPVVRTV